MGWRDVNEMRACELANGRAAMLGWVGWLWPQVFGLWQGGSVKTTDPIDAIMQVPTSAWCQFVVFCGAIEANKLNWDKGLVDPVASSCTQRHRTRCTLAPSSLAGPSRASSTSPTSRRRIVFDLIETSSESTVLLTHL